MFALELLDLASGLLSFASELTSGFVLLLNLSLSLSLGFVGGLKFDFKLRQSFLGNGDSFDQFLFFGLKRCKSRFQVFLAALGKIERCFLASQFARALLNARLDFFRKFSFSDAVNAVDLDRVLDDLQFSSESD